MASLHEPPALPCGRIPSKGGNHAMAPNGGGSDAGRMTNPNTTTMRAISQDAHGSPEVLKEVLIPRPVPGPSELLVAVRAAGVNPTDWRNRARAFTIDRLPLVLRWDVSGVVEAVGMGVTLFKPGDEVVGMLPYHPYGAGSHAEYVTAPPALSLTSPPASTTSRPAPSRSPPSPPTRHSSTRPASAPGSGSSSTRRPAASVTSPSPDRQVPWRVRHRHRQRRQARLPAFPRVTGW